MTRIRPADDADADAVCAIYNEGIAGRQATFETRPREPDEIREWLASGLPVLVAVDAQDRVIGFVRVSRYSQRAAYAGVAEHGVYVAGDARGRRVGRGLLEALAVECAQRGFWKLTSRVFVTNEASRKAHRAAGFSEVGVQRRHGRLDGEWVDVVLVERLIGEAELDLAVGA